MSNRIDELRNQVNKYLPELPDIAQKVLIIDDEFRNLRTFKSQFRRQAKVFTALNVDEALFYMRNKDIDIVFCDYLMPDVNGADILGIIAKHYPHVKRVVLTAYNTPETKKEFKDKSNTTNFIFKPYTFNEIFNSIYNVA